MSLKRSKSRPAANIPAFGVPVAPSLPPVPTVEESPLASIPLASRPLYLPKDSIVRKKALAIIAMRAAGLTTEQIAKELEIQPHTVSVYLTRANRAARAGILIDPKTGRSAIDGPIERIEYALNNKVVDNFEEMLNGAPIPEILERGQRSTRMEATFKLAELAMGPKLQPKESAPSMLNALKIEIVMPSTGQTTARQESIGGTPQNFIDVTPDAPVR